MTISGHNITRLAAASGLAEKTIRNWLAGAEIRETTRRHIERGIEQLKREGLTISSPINALRATDQEPVPRGTGERT